MASQSSKQSSCDIGKYKVVITTSSAYKENHIDGRIFIQLIGKNGDESNKKEITQHLKPGKSHRQTCVLELWDVGVPEFVWLDVIPFASDNNKWACDDVVVTYKNKQVRFPIYDWVDRHIKAAEGKAYTYTQADHELKDVRSKEIAQAKRKFEWIPKADNNESIGWGIPRYVNAKTYSCLPNMFKWKDERESNFFDAGLEAACGTTLGRLIEWFDFWTDFGLEHYKQFYAHVGNGEHPPFIDRWNTDKEFGRQQIMGASPLALKRFTYYPVGCGITDEFVRGVLGQESLEEERKEGKIFIGDYSTIFNGVERNMNDSGDMLYCPAVVGLFHADQDGDLVPIAIQLVPGDCNTIFTPNDSTDDWMLAKMYYRVAASNLHEWYHHFLLTHNVMEPFAVALFRNIPRSHPLYKLLRPHLQTVSAINTKARQLLIGRGTKANQSLAILGVDLARSAFKTFHMSDLILPKVLKERGLDDENAIPKNYFRDDALKMWTIIDKFVGSILELYYSCDKDVSDDAEIQAFAQDVAIEGLGWQDGNTRGMEKSITSLEQLVELCTTLIYTSSVGHAAVNFPQFQNYQFIPNSPVGMRLPPHKKGEATMKRIIDSLPDASMAVAQIAVTYTLSDLDRDEVCLGTYPMKLFTEDKAQAVIKNFQDDLKRVENEINRRNKTVGEDAYEFLLPSKVPNSIAI